MCYHESLSAAARFSDRIEEAEEEEEEEEQAVPAA